MEFRANIFLSEDKKPLRTSSIKITAESGVTVADAKAQCYASIKFPEGKTYEKSSEEIWLPNTGYNRNNKPAAAADDFLIDDDKKFRTIEYYVTVAEKK